MQRLLFIVSILLAFGCSSNNDNSRTQEPIVCFTFDDYYFENWIANDTLFAKAGIEATFFLSNYEDWNADDLSLLKLLLARGHELGYHSKSHANAKDFIASDKNAGDYIKEEISPGLDYFEEIDIKPSCFAFPYGVGPKSITRKLEQRFDKIRLLTHPVHDYSDVINSARDQVFAGVGLDSFYTQHQFENIEPLLDELNVTGGVLVLVGHRIGVQGTEWSTSVKMIGDIIEYCKERNIKMKRLCDV